MIHPEEERKKDLFCLKNKVHCLIIIFETDCETEYTVSKLMMRQNIKKQTKEMRTRKKITNTKVSLKNETSVKLRFLGIK